MPHYQARADDAYGGGSAGSSSPSSKSFLSPATAASPRSPPSTLNRNRSTASLRGASLAQSMDDDAGGARFSLAHELAAALMPEPSAGSRLLSEEFGIEFDEGAEGIDDEADEPPHDQTGSLAAELDPHSFGAEHSTHSDFGGPASAPPEDEMLDPAFGAPSQPAVAPKRVEQDAMATLAHDLETTDKFLGDLRRLDAESSAQPVLEARALAWIRKIDQSARDREGQVRALLEYEREFRRIAAEVGGPDTLAGLPMLDNVDLIDEAPAPAQTAAPSVGRPLSAVISEDGGDWEVDPDAYMQGEDDEGAQRGEGFEDAQATPVKAAFDAPPPPPAGGRVTPGAAVPQLAYLRSTTASLVSSLAAVSEHAQVNGAATADAGRKLRALKNKLGGWRTEWDSAERSRLKIERWEQEDVGVGGAGRRADGRKVVEEQMRAFERVVEEASRKTQAIMAAS